MCIRFTKCQHIPDSVQGVFWLVRGFISLSAELYIRIG